MMFLKFRYRLGYELLCREVADSISWQRFCRIPLGGQVPHPTTLVKLTRRLGEQTVAALNEALLATAAEHKVLRTHKVRADTTVVAANVSYPTDAGLLARAIGKLPPRSGASRPPAAPPAPGCGTAAAAARRRAHQLARTLRAPHRAGQAAGVAHHRRAGRPGRAGRRPTPPGWPATPAATWPAPAPGLREAGQAGRRPGDHHRADQQVIGQTRTRLAGGTPDGATRLVSLHDPDARPIVKGRLGKPVEFGYKAQVADNPDGVVLDYQVEVGNPADAPLLVPAVKRISQGRPRPPGR